MRVASEHVEHCVERVLAIRCKSIAAANASRQEGVAINRIALVDETLLERQLQHMQHTARNGRTRSRGR